jgi:GNAT superfamily N-acetyltransferase
MGLPDGVAIRGVTGVATDLADRLEVVYLAAFSREPHHEGRELAQAWAQDQLPRHAGRPGFRMVVAEGDEAIVGFAYGYTGAPGQWWTDAVGAGLTEQERARWLLGHFEFAELAVVPDLQRRGVGGGLHDALILGRREPTAALSTQDANAPALAFYLGRGWLALRNGFRFPGDDLGWSIMVRDLDPVSPSAW